MALEKKLALLGHDARYDLCTACGSGMARRLDDIGRWIHPAVRPDGKRIRLLRLLQTNVCENDCGYCAQRSGRDTPRTSISPDELARLYDELARRRMAEGLFLSSGVCGKVGRSTERMVATVELLRRRYAYEGYVHLKILPGADDACVEASVRLADRVSVNMEAPGPHRLRALSHAKRFGELLRPLRAAHRIRADGPRTVSLTTQLVVGPAGESDRELLSLASELYDQLELSRTYYSAFQPVRDTPLENCQPTPAWREHRLYQADFLLREYGFSFSELVFDDAGDLYRDVDPKLAWAREHIELFPIEMNRASYRELQRIPGIGRTMARRALERRRQGTLRTLGDLGIKGVAAVKVAPWVLLDGRRPARQLSLWDSAPQRDALERGARTGRDTALAPSA